MFEAVDVQQEVIDPGLVDQDSRLPNEEEKGRIGIPKTKMSENEMLAVKEEPDSPEIKYSNAQDYIEIEVEKFTNPNVAPTAMMPDITIKQEIQEPEINLLPIQQQAVSKLFTPLTVKEEVTDTPGTSDGQSHKVEAEAMPDCTTSSEATATTASGGNCSRLSNSTTSTEEKPHKCNFCSYQCKSFSNLKRHMSVHLGIKPHQCHICEYRCRESSKLKIHMRKHTGEKPYKCEVCDYQSRFPFNLTIHKRKHSEGEPFKCETCGFQSKVLVTFQRHLKNHENLFKCELCDYHNAHANNFKSHMRMHSDFKPFKCKDCDYQSKHLHQLTRHIRRHTGERPYKCQDCEYRAKTLCNLKVHMKKHIE